MSSVARKRSSRTSMSSLAKEMKTEEKNVGQNAAEQPDGAADQKSIEAAKTKRRNRALFNKLKR